jgi:antitoxin component of MazEF toxin-antitoxin module
MIISKIRKQGDVKTLTIPKRSNLQIGDYVKITKINETDSGSLRPNSESAVQVNEHV